MTARTARKQMTVNTTAYNTGGRLLTKLTRLFSFDE
jgi:hypothetical protein